MKGAKSRSDKSGNRLAVRKGKAGKDPNKPKRPPSAFFVFMEEFRVQYKEMHPDNKSVAAVSKAGGEKWKKLSDSDKAPYVAKAEKRKAEYTKVMAAYNRGESVAEDAGSDKSKSEVEDEQSGDDEGDDDE